MNTTPRILALVGSNSENSLNRQLAHATTKLLPAHFEIEIVDMLPFDTLPLYSGRRQADGFPEMIEQLLEKIAQADVLIIASPEHNGSIPAVFKNVIDWISRIDMKFLQNKPTLLLSTAPGQNGGATNLEQMAKLVPWWGAKLVDRLSLGHFHQRFSEGQPDAETRALLQSKIDLLVQNTAQPLGV